ncbi:MAG TPA: DUF3795 domain-containing protein [Myxococcales bacterium]
MTTEVKADPKLIAACGLYCGACGKLLKGKCPGCAANEKARWCAVRSCCKERGYASCADCTEFRDPRQCGKFDGFISKVIGLVLDSDRAKCIDRIRAVGAEQFAKEMADGRRQSLPRK